MKSGFAPLRQPFESEITEIETDRGAVENRIAVHHANLKMGVAWHPSGRFALATLNRTKGTVPMTRLSQGWTITNGLAVIWRDGRVDEVLLDEPDMGFADATDIACTPDGRYALVTSAGTDSIAVVDVKKLLSLIRSLPPYERQHVLPNHLEYPTEFVVKHIPTGKNPRAILIMPDGKRAFVANTLDDTLGVIDLAKMEMAGTVDLGGSKQSPSSAGASSCSTTRSLRSTSSLPATPASRRPCGRDDIRYRGRWHRNLAGRQPHAAGILDTAPFKWEGTNPACRASAGRGWPYFSRGWPLSLQNNWPPWITMSLPFHVRPTGSARLGPR